MRISRTVYAYRAVDRTTDDRTRATSFRTDEIIALILLTRGNIRTPGEAFCVLSSIRCMSNKLKKRVHRPTSCDVQVCVCVCAPHGTAQD